MSGPDGGLPPRIDGFQNRAGLPAGDEFVADAATVGQEAAVAGGAQSSPEADVALSVADATDSAPQAQEAGHGDGEVEEDRITLGDPDDEDPLARLVDSLWRDAGTSGLPPDIQDILDRQAQPTGFIDPSRGPYDVSRNQPPRTQGDHGPRVPFTEKERQYQIIRELEADQAAQSDPPPPAPVTQIAAYESPQAAAPGRNDRPVEAVQSPEPDAEGARAPEKAPVRIETAPEAAAQPSRPPDGPPQEPHAAKTPPQRAPVRADAAPEVPPASPNAPEATNSDSGDDGPPEPPVERDTSPEKPEPPKRWKALFTMLSGTKQREVAPLEGELGTANDTEQTIWTQPAKVRRMGEKELPTHVVGGPLVRQGIGELKALLDKDPQAVTVQMDNKGNAIITVTGDFEMSAFPDGEMRLLVDTRSNRNARRVRRNVETMLKTNVAEADEFTDIKPADVIPPVSAARFIEFEGPGRIDVASLLLPPGVWISQEVIKLAAPSRQMREGGTIQLTQYRGTQRQGAQTKLRVHLGHAYIDNLPPVLSATCILRHEGGEAQITNPGLETLLARLNNYTMLNRNARENSRLETDRYVEVMQRIGLANLVGMGERFAHDLILDARSAYSLRPHEIGSHLQLAGSIPYVIGRVTARTGRMLLLAVANTDRPIGAMHQATDRGRARIVQAADRLPRRALESPEPAESDAPPDESNAT